MILGCRFVPILGIEYVGIGARVGAHEVAMGITAVGSHDAEIDITVVGAHDVATGISVVGSNDVAIEITVVGPHGEATGIAVLGAHKVATGVKLSGAHGVAIGITVVGAHEVTSCITEVVGAHEDVIIMALTCIFNIKYTLVFESIHNLYSCIIGHLASLQFLGTHFMMGFWQVGDALVLV